MQDHLPNLAEHFLVFKIIAYHPEIRCSQVVARQSCCSIDALRLKRTLDAIINQLSIYDIGIANVTGDGATENVAFHNSSYDTPLKDFISDEIKLLFTKHGLHTYLSYEVATKDPRNEDLIYFMEDMPHMVKRKVNALSNSSKYSKSRNLYYSEHPMNINMIKRIWELTGGEETGVHITKCRGIHWNKDNFNKQRVYLSVQVVSDSVVRMIKMAFDDGTIKEQISCTKEQYDPLAFCRHINRYVDIINGRDGTKSYNGHWTPEKANDIIDELLTIFAWFHKWRDTNESLNLDKSNFLAQETWNGFKRMIFGYVGLIDYYVRDRGMIIVPRRTLSDPCEHLFSRMRDNGSTSNVTTKSANATCIRENFSNANTVIIKCQRMEAMRKHLHYLEATII